MKTENRKESRSSHLLVLVFVMLAAGIITAGYFYYENYERQYRSEMERQLSAVADLKEHELVQWRKERLGDANVFYKNIVFSGLAKRYFENQSDADAKKRIKAFMGQVQAAYSYSRICLHDAAGVERISIPEGKIHSPFIFSLRSAEVLKSGKVEFQDFYRDENDKKVYLTIFIPVLDEYDTSRVLGVLAMRIDPEQSLYPIISRWLTPSRTAEILISRREGNDILFLNELKYQKNTALSLRVSMENKKLPSVRAALGQQGIVEGVDYRGVPVLADVRKVPDSPWLLVARMDLSEVYAPVRERLWMIFVIVGLLLVSAGAGTGFLHRQQRMRFYLEQYKADEALRDSEERYRTTMMSVGDGVITTDSEGRLELLNPVAETLTGWRQEESSDKPLEEVFRIINEETRQIVENPVRRVMREGIVVGLANHSVLIAKDGTEHPIADSGAPIRNEKGEITGVVLVFRDQTQERMAQKALQESELKFRDTVKYLDEAYYSVTTDGLLIEHNQAYNRILGIDITQDLKGQKTPDFWQNPDERKVYLQELMTKGSIINYLINAKTISGKKVVVMANSHLVKDEKGGLVRIEGTFTDFTE
ncbi:PAS domain S-box protein, partial [bacterium]